MLSPLLGKYRVLPALWLATLAPASATDFCFISSNFKALT